MICTGLILSPLHECFTQHLDQVVRAGLAGRCMCTLAIKPLHCPPRPHLS